MSNKVSKFRGLDRKVLQTLQEHKQLTLHELRSKYTLHGYGAVRYSINSLKHKGLIKEDNTVITLVEGE